jgi:YD repeat-containing protein
MLDPAGRRTSETDGDGTVRTYGYDGIDRLISETVTGSQILKDVGSAAGGVLARRFGENARAGALEGSLWGHLLGIGVLQVYLHYWERPVLPSSSTPVPPLDPGQNLDF